MIVSAGPLTVGAALALGGGLAEAASPFNGRWVDDLKTQMGEAGFDNYLIADGRYTCASCSPPRTHPADGKMYAVAGDPEVRREAVTLAGRRAIVIRSVGPDMVRETIMTVAANGQTATYVSLDKWPNRAKRLRTEYRAQRVAPAPPGAHAASGSWRGFAYVQVPEEYRSVELREAHGRFTRSNFRRGHYTTVIGGHAVPITGDGKNIYSAAIAAPDVRTRVETIFQNGKRILERTYRLSADGKSMVTTVSSDGGKAFSATSHRR